MIYLALSLYALGCAQAWMLDPNDIWPREPRSLLKEIAWILFWPFIVAFLVVSTLWERP